MGRYAGEEYGDGSVSEDSWRALKTQYRMMEDRAVKAEAELAAANARIAELEERLVLRTRQWTQHAQNIEAGRDAALDDLNREYAENAALSARLERVRALAAKVEATRTDDDRAEWYAAVHELTAAALGEDA